MNVSSHFVRASKKLGGGEINEDSDSAIVNQWQIPPKDLIYEEKRLGEGQFGTVFQGTLRGKTVAIKKLNFQFDDEIAMNDFKQEVTIMAKLRHPNILLFMGAVTIPGKMAIVTELMPNGSVYSLLYPTDPKTKKVMETKTTLLQRVSFARDACLGMNGLHGMKPPFLHLDLKTQNLLVDENFQVKVADFGLSKIKISSALSGRAGSPLYMAPEMLLGQDYNEKADVYSFGIILWELLAVKEPYEGKYKSINDITDGVCTKGERPALPESPCKKWTELIQACWNPSPKNRPSFDTMIKNRDFDVMLVDTAISEANEIGRQLWKDNFLGQQNVPFIKFIPVFNKYSGCSIPQDKTDILYQLPEEMFCTKVNGENVVFLENFGSALEWIGPLKNDKKMLQEIHDLFRTKGFFGDIETGEAEKKMSGKSKGTYLIRFSSNKPGSYAITVRDTSDIRHYRISHKAGQPYELSGIKFASLDEVISKKKKDLHLSTPCEGSKFEAMFKAWEKRIDVSGYVTPPTKGK